MEDGHAQIEDLVGSECNRRPPPHTEDGATAPDEPHDLLGAWAAAEFHGGPVLSWGKIRREWRACQDKGRPRIGKATGGETLALR